MVEEGTGFEAAWAAFSRLDPFEVCTRSGASFNESLQLYTVRSFGQDIFISPDRQEVFSDSPEGKSLIRIKEYFFALSVLWYLVSTRDISLSGNLVNPSTVPGGQIFLKGTHVLPLDAIARKYNERKGLFRKVGSRYGGIAKDYGDAALELLPFPKVPVHIILWFGDEDFPPRGQLLLDSTCSSHLPTDVIWAVTMICCLLFLSEN